jgi:hypothetical protein
MGVRTRDYDIAASLRASAGDRADRDRSWIAETQGEISFEKGRAVPFTMRFSTNAARSGRNLGGWQLLFA